MNEFGISASSVAVLVAIDSCLKSDKLYRSIKTLPQSQQTQRMCNGEAWIAIRVVRAAGIGQEWGTMLG